jgi:hypothetical protein
MRAALHAEGVTYSSRWSQRSEDHRKPASSSSAPWRGATVFWHAVPGADRLLFFSGGLRYAATTGYYLTAFQAEVTPKPDNQGDNDGIGETRLSRRVAGEIH